MKSSLVLNIINRGSFLEFLHEVTYRNIEKNDFTLNCMMWEVNDYFISMGNLLINNNYHLYLKEEIIPTSIDDEQAYGKMQVAEHNGLTNSIYIKMTNYVVNSIFVNVYSQLEAYIYQMCNLYMEAGNVQAKVVNESGNSVLDKAKNYLQKKIGIANIDESDEWKELNDKWRIIRNSIVHNRAIVPDNKIKFLEGFEDSIKEEHDIISGKSVKIIQLKDTDVALFMLLAQKVLIKCIK